DRGLGGVDDLRRSDPSRAARGAALDDARRAVIAREHDGPAVAADLAIELVEEGAEALVEAQHEVEGLPRVGSPQVTRVVARVEAEREQIGDVILAEGERG